MPKRTYHVVAGEPGFYVDTLSKNLVFIKSIEGKKLKFSCKTPDIKKAKKYANKRLKYYFSRNPQNGDMPTVGHWLDLYLDHRNSLEHSPSTVRICKTAIEQAKPYWDMKETRSLTREEWVKFCDWHKKKYGIQLELVHKYFKNFLRWLEDTQYDGRPVILRAPKVLNPEAKKTRLDRKLKKSRIFTSEEIRKILSVCDPTERLLVLLMYTMAFRVESDALSARRDQFRFTDSPPTYVFGEADNKAGLEGRQAIHKGVIDAFMDYYDYRITNFLPEDTPWVFPQNNDPSKHLRPSQIDWKGIRARADLGWHWTPHTFRHTCLTMLAEADYPMHLICKCYRISATEFLKTYAHLTKKGLEKMQNAIQI